MECQIECEMQIVVAYTHNDEPSEHEMQKHFTIEMNVLFVQSVLLVSVQMKSAACECI